jgi:hypothetical protein
LWQRYKAERGVWSEKMLLALEGGMKEKPLFSLIDKVYEKRTLALAWPNFAGAIPGFSTLHPIKSAIVLFSLNRPRFESADSGCFDPHKPDRIGRGCPQDRLSAPRLMIDTSRIPAARAGVPP